MTISMTMAQYHITILIRITTIEYISNNIMISMTISITMNQYYQHHQFTLKFPNQGAGPQPWPDQSHRSWTERVARVKRVV
jgi:hypothetical protein